MRITTDLTVWVYHTHLLAGGQGLGQESICSIVATLLAAISLTNLTDSVHLVTILFALIKNSSQGLAKLHIFASHLTRRQALLVNSSSCIPPPSFSSLPSGNVVRPQRIRVEAKLHYAGGQGLILTVTKLVCFVSSQTSKCGGTRLSYRTRSRSVRYASDGSSPTQSTNVLCLSASST